MPKKSRKSRKGSRSSRPSPLSDVRQVAQSVARLAPFALSAFKGALSAFNPEVKHSDVVDNSTISTTPLLLLLSGIAEGDTNVTRDGTSVKVAGMYGRVNFIVSTAATNSSVRFIILVDLENQGADPTAADILDTSSTAIGLQNLDSRPGRFAFLIDKVVNLVSGAASSSRVELEYNLTPQIKNTHLKFSGTGATVASCQGPTIYALLMSTEATNTPTVRTRNRLFYLDN